MLNNKDWVSVENSPTIRKKARAKERAKDPMHKRNFGIIREDSGLPPLEKPGLLRKVKDTLRGLVGMPSKEEERRKKQEKKNKKRLQAELQKEHDNKGGSRRTRRKRKRSRRQRSRRQRRTRRRTHRRKSCTCRKCPKNCCPCCRCKRHHKRRSRRI